MLRENTKRSVVRKESDYKVVAEGDLLWARYDTEYP
jgi:hypothetical protein